MAETVFFRAIRKRWGTIVLVGLLTGALSFFGLTLLSKSFKATTDFLVVQNSSETQDFYSMLKSSEYLGKVLSESVYSEKFIGAVIETGGVNDGFIPAGGKDRLKAWSKMVSVKSNPDAGILHVIVYGNNERDALRISQAISKVLVERNVLFRSGAENSVEIRTLSGPIVEPNPSLQTLAVAAGSGALFGISLVLLILFWRMGGFEMESNFASNSNIASQHDFTSRGVYASSGGNTPTEHRAERSTLIFDEA